MRLASRAMLAAAVLLIAAAEFNCARKPTSNSSRENTYLGMWIWKMTTGGIAGMTLTPESTGHTQALELSADSTYRRYMDDTLVTGGHYTLTWEVVPWPTDSGYVIRFDDWWSGKILEWNTDTLGLIDLYEDGFWYSYVRGK